MGFIKDNQCVGCPQGCIHCGRDEVYIPICDNCESEEIIYSDDYGNMLCRDCMLEKYEDKEFLGICGDCGEEVDKTYDGLCAQCFIESCGVVE